MTTLPDLLALLPDNTAGDITAADMREVTTDLWNHGPAIYLGDRAGIHFDGTTTSAATLQAVLDTAAGKTVTLPPGRLVLDGPITLPANVHVIGQSVFVGAGTSATSEVAFPTLTGTQVGITHGESCVLENLLIRGPGYASTCVGVSSTAAALTYRNVQVYSWGVGIRMTNAYYSVLDRCEWRFNAVSLDMSNCNNTVLLAPRFSCRNEANTVFGIGIRNGPSSPVEPLSIFGGSFESFGGSGTVAAIVLGVTSTLNLYGTYFESATAASGAVGIIGADNCSLVLQGCLVNLQENNRWVSMAGALASRIYGRGNSFYANAASSTTPVGYVVGPGTSLDVDDNISQLAKGSHYSALVADLHTLPSADGLLKNYGHSVSVPPGRWIRTGRDTTANMPAPATAGSGASFWDTTVGRGKDSNGAAWMQRAYKLAATASLDFPSLPAGSSAELSVTVTGAVAGEDGVSCAPAGAISNGLVWCAYVSAADTVKIRLANVTAAAIDLGAVNWRVWIIR